VPCNIHIHTTRNEQQQNLMNQTNPYLGWCLLCVVATCKLPSTQFHAAYQLPKFLPGHQPPSPHPHSTPCPIALILLCQAKDNISIAETLLGPEKVYIILLLLPSAEQRDTVERCLHPATQFCTMLKDRSHLAILEYMRRLGWAFQEHSQSSPNQT
jgi:hypothetical protein